MNTSKKRSSLLLTLIAASILGSGYYFFYPAKQSSSSAKPETDLKKSGYVHGKRESAIPVSIESVRQRDFPVYVNALGSINPLKTVNVRSKVDGELLKVHFKEGALVKQGELLAEIDPSAYTIQLQQAEGQLQRDQATLKNAELDLQRYRTLLAQDSTSAQQVSSQEALVKQYRGTVAIDSAQVNNAKLQLSYTRITAPISGKVGLRLLDPGNLVRANDSAPLVVITQLQPIGIVFTLAEDKIPALLKNWRNRNNLAIEIYDRSAKNKLADGTLLAIDNQIDSSTGTLKLKAQSSNQESNLFANQFVNVKMLLETLNNSLVIPNAALQHDLQGAFVFVVKDKQAQKRYLTLGPGNSDETVVLDQLNAQDAVVIDGLDKLEDGAKVEIAVRDGQKLPVEAKGKPDPVTHL